ncbi:DUF6817 domain-containing protein [Streptomyces sp. NBC_01538]|uniref:DUF6817 domain-containing protein n=1 Tax=Streptomyces sp. NBC_01538 TaxID=2903897 RepID=UPI003863F44A
MDKVMASAADAVADIPEGASLAVGGFGLRGIPTVLIDALYAQGADGLRVSSNNCGVDGQGLGILLAAGSIARVTGSYVGERKPAQYEIRGAFPAQPMRLNNGAADSPFHRTKAPPRYGSRTSCGERVVPSTAAQTVGFLRQLGAEQIGHPGGTLLAHLCRVYRLLAAWDARSALRLAGLCHAAYGTDGFPTALLSLDRRVELAQVIGPEAEEIVHVYAAMDRKATYPGPATPNAPYRDRFTGGARAVNRSRREDLAELTAANELDLARVNPAFRQQWGPDLLALFTGFQPLRSGPAWEEVGTVLGGGRDR